MPTANGKRNCPIIDAAGRPVRWYRTPVAAAQALEGMRNRQPRPDGSSHNMVRDTKGWTAEGRTERMLPARLSKNLKNNQHRWSAKSTADGKASLDERRAYWTEKTGRKNERIRARRAAKRK